VLDPKLIRVFLVLAEELSFSRAAVQLNVAQPWISERIRRLEEHAGVRLFHRTSRTVELSAEGLAFLPRAKAIIDTLNQAESALRVLRGAGASKISLGSFSYYNHYPERRILVDRFMKLSPNVRLDIRWGSADEVLPPLLNGETDLVFSSINSVDNHTLLESTPVCTRTGLVMVPREHPFAGRDAIDLEELAGCRVAVSRGYLSRFGRRGALGPLLDVGAEFVEAPEARRATIEHYARVHRIMCLRWLPTMPANRDVNDMVLTPIRGNPLTTTTVLWRRRGSRSPSALAFWRNAVLLHRVITTGDAEPMYGAIKDEIERPLADLT